MKLKFGKILETASLNSGFSGLKKTNSVLRLVHFQKNLKPIVVVIINVYPATTSTALYVIQKKLWYGKQCSFLLH